MKRYWLRIMQTSATALIATAVVVFAMLWLSGAFHRGKIAPGGQSAMAEPLPPATAPAQIALVQRVTRGRYAELVGSVQAEYRSAVSARLTANILEVRVRAGDHVKAGDVLVVLDDRDLKARVGQAAQVLKAAEAKRDITQLEFDRVTKLASERVASPYELEQWQAQHAAAVAEVARATQALREAEVGLSDSIVKSPITGIVIDRLAEPGDQASPGKPILTIYDPSRLRLEASVREGYVGRVAKGDSIDVYIDARREQRKGTIEEIVPASDPLSRSFLIKVNVTDPSGLYPGMYGRVKLPLEPQQRLEIPTAAVEQIGQVALVQALVDGRPHRRAVRLGHVSDGHVEILAGLNEGDRVLLPIRPE